LDKAERLRHPVPYYLNGIGTACDGQASGITAFLSAIGRLNEDKKRDPLGDSALWTAIPQLIENTIDHALERMAGQRSNQLNYVPTRQINNFAENLAGQGICRFCIERTVRTECPSKPLFLAKPPVNRL
jgi:hypothetical protein